MGPAELRGIPETQARGLHGPESRVDFEETFSRGKMKARRVTRSRATPKGEDPLLIAPECREIVIKGGTDGGADIGVRILRLCPV